MKVWLTLQIKEGKISASEADRLWEEAKPLWAGDGKKAMRVFVDYFSPASDMGLVAVVAKDLGRHVGKTRVQMYKGVHVYQSA